MPGWSQRIFFYSQDGEEPIQGVLVGIEEVAVIGVSDI